MRKAAIVVGVLFAIAVCVDGCRAWYQRRACARAGYPRTIDAGFIWTNIRCVQFVDGTEVVK